VREVGVEGSLHGVQAAKRGNIKKIKSVSRRQRFPSGDLTVLISSLLPFHAEFFGISVYQRALYTKDGFLHKKTTPATPGSSSESTRAGDPLPQLSTKGGEKEVSYSTLS
jgi:hypothetical protein